jgi:hypothetical protein
LEKTNQLYVVPALAKCYSITTYFDLWMSKGAYNVFALMINFLNNNWQPKHVIINVFEATKILRQTLAKSLTKLWDKYGFFFKITAYVKDEGFNLNSMIIVLKSIVNCESFELEENFQGICFGHVFSKTC